MNEKCNIENNNFILQTLSINSTLVALLSQDFFTLLHYYSYHSNKVNSKLNPISTKVWAADKVFGLIFILIICLQSGVPHYCFNITLRSGVLPDLFYLDGRNNSCR